jgi:NTP pyrophosphatase (non-canonical NTP hydrolase)
MSHDLKTFAGLVSRAESFRDERDWRHFHSLRNLAAAIAVEAAELQETLLWLDDAGEGRAVDERRQRLEEELADILIHCANFASAAGIDISAALAAKFDLNEQKYPVDKARGTATKYDAL